MNLVLTRGEGVKNPRKIMEFDYYFAWPYLQNCRNLGVELCTYTSFPFIARCWAGHRTRM